MSACLRLQSNDASVCACVRVSQAASELVAGLDLAAISEN